MYVYKAKFEELGCWERQTVCLSGSKDQTLPSVLLSTNFPTYVKINGLWSIPENPRMDSHIVLNPNSDRLVIKEFRLIKKGDLVAVAQHEDGSDGVFVWDRGFAEEDLQRKHFLLRTQR